MELKISPSPDTQLGLAPASESAGSCWCREYREAELRGGCRECSGWQDAGREWVLGPSPEMGCGPGAGRGDSRFADITEGVGADGSQKPRRCSHCTPAPACTPGAPRNHRSLAPAPLVSGSLQLVGSQLTLPRTPRACIPHLGRQKPTFHLSPTSLDPHVHGGWILAPYNLSGGRLELGLQHWGPLPLSTPEGLGGFQ